MSSLETRMRAANPIPDARTEFDDDEVAALLILTRARSGDMDMKEMVTPGGPEERPRRGWLVAAAAAAAVVVLLVGAVALIDLGTDDIDPAAPPSEPTTTVAPAETETPPTTVGSGDPDDGVTAPPALDEEEADVARSIVDAINRGDADAVTGIIMSAGSVESIETPGEDARARESGRWASWALLDSQAELLGCVTTTGGVTRCEITRSSPSDYTSADPQVGIVEIRTDDGVVEWMRFDVPLGAWFAQEQRFFDWVIENHPEDRVPIFVDFSNPQATADLIRERYAEWLDDQAG